MVGKWLLECPAGTLYEGECEYSKDDGFVLHCPKGVKPVEEVEGGGCVEEEIKRPEKPTDKTKYWELPPYEKRVKKESNPEPIAIIRGKKTYSEVFHEPAECHPSSFRVIRPKEGHLLTVCCPTGQWEETRPAGQQCVTSMMAQKLEHLHPVEEGHA